jgi:hypothetical protein
MPLGVFGIGVTELIILLACPLMLVALGGGVFAVVYFATRLADRSAGHVHPPQPDENRPDDTRLP